MLRISKKADCAIVALSHLSMSKKPSSAKEIAEYYSFSSPFLANILKSLALAGLLESKRGSKGGYILGKKPEEISVGEVLKVIEGPLELSECSTDENKCSVEHYCPAKKPLQLIHQHIKKVFDNLSLADITHFS